MSHPHPSPKDSHLATIVTMMSPLRLGLFLTAPAALATAAAAVGQVHLGLLTAAVDCPQGIAVTFASNDSAPATVTLTTDDGGGDVSASTTVDFYAVDDGTYHYKSPYLHTAKLCNLAPSTTYSYEIEDSDFDGAAFTSLPAVGDRNVPTVIGVVGDIGSTDTEGTLRNVATSLADSSASAHAVFIVGDFAYGNGEHEVWDDWFDAAQSVLSTVPSVGINGNHETIKGGGAHKDKKDVGPENYLAYIKRVGVTTPATPEALAALRTYYSIDVGLVHCVFLDDYVGHRGKKDVVGTDAWRAERARQLQWFQDDLTRVNRTATPWTVVLKHNPYYNTFEDHQCKCSPERYAIDDPEVCWDGVYDPSSDDASSKQPHCGLQAKFEDVYLEHGVDLVVAGHVHAYERTAAIKKNQVDWEDGVVYVTSGAGGQSPVDGYVDENPEWSVKTISDVAGGLRIVATADSLKAAWFANGKDTPDDEFTLTADGTPEKAVAAKKGL
ncbi:Aste57867_11116 [Aphanomyces stellatus]|uniref:Purple acid phosphatase n=1 Tax=Aphanomyces stellatus TaxID=120398 RepID=A0A485KTA3_9STRA|nr:hypothetical protein As57867_011074 [Aphanomyces stellatus]VFT87983.1 Aste57867_11116 [Aphanomyces stellatus]